VAGNERPTGMTGAVLLLLFAAEGLTLLLPAAATVHLAARWEAMAPVDVPLGRLEQAHWYIDGLRRPGQGVIRTVRDSV
jgi:hypothetical protein